MDIDFNFIEHCLELAGARILESVQSACKMGIWLSCLLNCLAVLVFEL